MKNLILFLFSILAWSTFAQTTCQTSQPFCAGGVSGVNYPASINSGAAQVGPNYGCLMTQPNPSWYYLQVSTPGNLIILIQGQTNTSPPGPGQDVDFICWGPFSSLSGICNSLTATNIVDCSYSSSFTETLTIPTGLTGQYYLVLITNFANVTQNIQFSQIGGTGNTNCSLVSSNTTICMGTNITFTTNPPIGLSNVIYTLSPGSFTSSTPSFTINPTANTTYSILSSGYTNQNILQTQTAVCNVTVNPTANLTPTVINSTCTSSISTFSLGLQFNPSNATPNYTVTWNTIPLGIANQTQVTSTGPLVAGGYQATVTLAGGCAVTTNFTIEPTPATANFTVLPVANVYSITCYQPTLNLTANNTANSYSWTNFCSPAINSASASISSTCTSNWTIFAQNPISNCVASRTIMVVQNTSPPLSVLSPSFQSVNCNLSSISCVTISASPTVNVTQNIISPSGGTLSANTATTIYCPGTSGTFTHHLINLVNGCSVAKVFSVVSSQGYPVFNLNSPQNFTLGCSSKSLAIVNIINPNTSPTGGSLTYTVLSPNASTVLPPQLSSISSYTINSPGTWTFVTKDATTFCETRIPISILQNAFAPKVDSLSIPQQILDCTTPSIVLEGFNNNTNTDFVWQYKSGGLTQNLTNYSVAVNVNTLNINTTLISNYTLVLTDRINLCSNQTVIPIYQNIFQPKGLIKAGSTASISCTTSSVLLTNASTSGIPNSSGFINSKPAVAYQWMGPSPQLPLQLNSSYIANVPGIYTLTALDLNNGCYGTATLTVGDDRIYPSLTNSPSPVSILDCGASSTTLGIDAQTNQGNLIYTWVPPTNAVYSGSLNDKIFHASTLGIYRVVVKDTKNGCASSGMVTVKNGSLTASIEVDQNRGYAPFTVNFKNNSYSSNDTSQINSIWSFGNGKSETNKFAGHSPQTIYTLPGTYTVTVYLQKGDCMASTSNTIYVDIPSDVSVPNIFTPNGDRVNDEFFLKANNLSEINFSVFDRWGQLIYNSKSETGNIVWDGKNKSGKIVDDGTYFYMLKATGSDGKAYNQNGTVTVAK